MMDITNARRILVLGSPNSGQHELLRDLTGSSPLLVNNSLAGVSHEWRLETQYYNVTIPIWIDEIQDTELWRSEFMQDEAAEVIGAIGGWIYCFRRPLTEIDLTEVKAGLKAISDAINKHSHPSMEICRMAIVMPQPLTPCLEKSFEEWDDVCRTFNFEFIDSESRGKSEFGEQQGMARLKEALSANEWATDTDETLVDEVLAEFNFNSDDDSILTFAEEEAEMNRELLGASMSLHQDEGAETVESGSTEAVGVEEMQAMMVTLQAAKDRSTEMSELERRKFARETVADIIQKYNI